MEYYTLKKPISPEKYEKMLEYNRIYYANMGDEQRAAYLERKRLYNLKFRSERKQRQLEIKARKSV